MPDFSIYYFQLININIKDLVKLGKRRRGTANRWKICQMWHGNFCRCHRTYSWSRWSNEVFKGLKMQIVCHLNTSKRRIWGKMTSISTNPFKTFKRKIKSKRILLRICFLAWLCKIFLFIITKKIPLPDWKLRTPRKWASCPWMDVCWVSALFKISGIQNCEVL